MLRQTHLLPVQLSERLPLLQQACKCLGLSGNARLSRPVEDLKRVSLLQQARKATEEATGQMLCFPYRSQGYPWL